MSKINRMGPNHKGTFPVRVLQFNILAEFEQTLSGSDDPMHAYIVQAGELSPGISYHIDEVPIEDAAWIIRGLTIEKDGGIKECDFIHIYENYLQLLWSLSYSILVAIERHPVGSGLGETEDFLDAVRVFSTGVSLLFPEYDLKRIRSLPNPEEYEHEIEPLIGQANGVMVRAALFVLLHEAGHHHFGHTSRSTLAVEAKEQELAADEFAFEIIMQLGDKEKKTALLGLIVAFISILLKDGNTGGKSHPLPLYRLQRLLENTNESADSIQWLYAFFALYMWLLDYRLRWGFDFELPMLLTDQSSFANYQHIMNFAVEICTFPDSYHG